MLCENLILLLFFVVFQYVSSTDIVESTTPYITTVNVTERKESTMLDTKLLMTQTTPSNNIQDLYFANVTQSVSITPPNSINETLITRFDSPNNDMNGTLNKENLMTVNPSNVVEATSIPKAPRKIIIKQYVYAKSQKPNSITLQLCALEYLNMAIQNQLVWHMYVEGAPNNNISIPNLNKVFKNDPTKENKMVGLDPMHQNYQHQKSMGAIFNNPIIQPNEKVPLMEKPEKILLKNQSQNLPNKNQLSLESYKDYSQSSNRLSSSLDTSHRDLLSNFLNGPNVNAKIEFGMNKNTLPFMHVQGSSDFNNPKGSEIFNQKDKNNVSNMKLKPLNSTEDKTDMGEKLHNETERDEKLKSDASQNIKTTDSLNNLQNNSNQKHELTTNNVPGKEVSKTEDILPSVQQLQAPPINPTESTDKFNQKIEMNGYNNPTLASQLYVEKSTETLSFLEKAMLVFETTTDYVSQNGNELQTESPIDENNIQREETNNPEEKDSTTPGIMEDVPTKDENIDRGEQINENSEVPKDFVETTDVAQDEQITDINTKVTVNSEISEGNNLEQNDATLNNNEFTQETTPLLDNMLGYDAPYEPTNQETSQNPEPTNQDSQPSEYTQNDIGEQTGAINLSNIDTDQKNNVPQNEPSATPADPVVDLNNVEAPVTENVSDLNVEQAQSNDLQNRPINSEPWKDGIRGIKKMTIENPIIKDEDIQAADYTRAIDDKNQNVALSQSQNKEIPTNNLEPQNSENSQNLEPQNVDNSQKNLESQITENFQNNLEPQNTENPQNNLEPQNTDNSQNNPKLQNTENPQNNLEIQNTENSQNNLEPQNTENSQNNLEPQNIENSQNNLEPQNTENTQNNLESQNTENSQNNLEPQNTENTQNNLEPQNTENSQNNVEPQNTENSQNNMEPQNTQNSQYNMEPQNTENSLNNIPGITDNPNVQLSDNGNTDTEQGTENDKNIANSDITMPENLPNSNIDKEDAKQTLENNDFSVLNTGSTSVNPKDNNFDLEAPQNTRNPLNNAPEAGEKYTNNQEQEILLQNKSEFSQKQLPNQVPNQYDQSVRLPLSIPLEQNILTTAIYSMDSNVPQILQNCSVPRQNEMPTQSFESVKSIVDNAAQQGRNIIKQTLPSNMVNSVDVQKLDSVNVIKPNLEIQNKANDEQLQNVASIKLNKEETPVLNSTQLSQINSVLPFEDQKKLIPQQTMNDNKEQTNENITNQTSLGNMQRLEYKKEIQPLSNNFDVDQISENKSQNLQGLPNFFDIEKKELINKNPEGLKSDVKPPQSNKQEASLQPKDPLQNNFRINTNGLSYESDAQLKPNDNHYFDWISLPKPRPNLFGNGNYHLDGNSNGAVPEVKTEATSTTTTTTTTTPRPKPKTDSGSGKGYSFPRWSWL